MTIEEHDSIRSEKSGCLVCAACGARGVVPPWFIREFATLSPRERAVALHLARGLTNREIAKVFGRSPDTVRKQTIRIYDKVRASGRTEIAVWMTAAGFVTSE
jgi:DNA-binding NarL/FixJ family response regulator